MAYQSKYLTINGVRMHYIDEGEGFPLVLTHAGIANLEMWASQIEEFSKKYRVIAYDMRGFGKTGLIPGEYAHYKDLVVLLDALKIKKCVLVGCSMGGGVVIEAALVDPARIERLVVVAGFARGLEFDPEPASHSKLAATHRAFEEDDLDLANELEIEMWVDGYEQPAGRADEAIRNAVGKMNRIAIDYDDANPDAMEKRMEPEAYSQIDRLTMPSLFIYGDLDNQYTIEAIEKMVAEMPNAQREIILGTAHLPNMEKPEEFNQHVAKFLGDVLG